MDFWYDPQRQVIINKVDWKNYWHRRWYLPMKQWWRP